MLQWFNTRHPAVYALLVIICALLYLSGGFSSPVVTEPLMPLYRLIIIEGKSNLWIYQVSALLLFVMQTVYLNSLVVRFEVMNKTSFYPGLMYAVWMGSVPELMTFSPALIANTLLLAMLDRLFQIYKSSYAQSCFFEAAVLLSLAICFYLPAAVFVLLMVAAGLILRPFDWRHWMSALFGLLTPPYLLMVIFFLTDKTEYITSGWQHYRLYIIPTVMKSIPESYLITLFTGFLFTVLGVHRLRMDYYRSSSQTRLFQQIIVLFLLISLLSLFFSSSSLSPLVLPVVAMAVLTAILLHAMKRKWMAEVCFFFLLLLAIMNRLKPDLAILS
jgi:hypothetical protein